MSSPEGRRESSPFQVNTISYVSYIDDERPDGPSVLLDTAGREGLDDMSSMSGSQAELSGVNSTAISRREEAARKRAREAGFRLQYKVSEDILGQYDALLDPHCMITKAPRFQGVARRMLKLQYQEKYSRQLHHPPRRRLPPALPTRHLTVRSAGGPPKKEKEKKCTSPSSSMGTVSTHLSVSVAPSLRPARSVASSASVSTGPSSSRRPATSALPHRPAAHLDPMGVRGGGKSRTSIASVTNRASLAATSLQGPTTRHRQTTQDDGRSPSPPSSVGDDSAMLLRATHFDLLGPRSLVSPHVHAVSSCYTALSPYLTANGPYLAPQNRKTVPTEVANGTLLLMLAGLTTSVATISFGPPDTLHDLRGLMVRDLSDVFPAGFSFMDRDHVPFPHFSERDVPLSELGGAVFVRPRVHRTISRPLYCPAAEAECPMTNYNNSSNDAVEMSGGVTQRQAAAQQRHKFDSITLGTTRTRRLSSTGALEHGCGDGLSDVAVLEEAVARLVAKYTHEAAKVLQRVGRGYLGRQRTALTRHHRDTHQRISRAATKIQASFRRFCAVHVLEKRKNEFLDFMKDQMLSVPRFNETFDFDSKTMKLPDHLNDTPLPPLTATAKGDEKAETLGHSTNSSMMADGPAFSAPVAITVRRRSEMQRRLEHLPLLAVLGVIKIQSIFRRRLARRKADDKKREREKDAALDAAFGRGRGHKKSDVVNAQEAERCREALLKARRKTLQVSLASAQRSFLEEMRRKSTLALDPKTALRANHRNSSLTMSMNMGLGNGTLGGAAASAVLGSNNNGWGTSPPAAFSSLLLERGSNMGSDMMQTIQDVLADADLETEMIGVAIHSTEVPISEGVLNVKVCKTDEEIRFLASASTQAQTSYLSFRGDSPDPEVREYYASLSRPEGARLLQLMCLSISYQPSRSQLVMDLNAYGGRCHDFTTAHAQRENRRLLSGHFNPQHFVAQRYLLLKCYAREGDDCRWRIHVEAVNSATGDEYTTAVGCEMWEKLGMGPWETLCALERQFLVRLVCLGLRLSKRGQNVGGLEARIDLTGKELNAEVDSKGGAIELHAVDLGFAMSSLPPRRLLSRVRVMLSGEVFIITCYQAPRHILVRAFRCANATFYEAELEADDVIYFLATPVEDRMAFCKTLSTRLSFTINHLGQAALRLPVDSIAPFVRFSYDTWAGEAQATVHVYKAGNKLLIVARERDSRETYFAIIRSSQYKRWDISNFKRVTEDVAVQEALISLLRTRITLAPRLSAAKNVYLSLEAAGGAAARERPAREWDAEDAVINEAAIEAQLKRTDDSLAYGYVGVLVDR